MTKISAILIFFLEKDCSEMKTLTVDFSNSLCSQGELLPLLKKLEPEIERVKNVVHMGMIRSTLP